MSRQHNRRRRSNRWRVQFSLASLFVVATSICLFSAYWHYVHRPWMEFQIRLNEPPSQQLSEELAAIDGVTSLAFDQGKLIVEIRLPGKLAEILATLRRHDVDCSRFSLTQNSAMAAHELVEQEGQRRRP